MLIKTKEEIIALKTDLILKSIEFGLYFKELEDKHEKSFKLRDESK
ncbi:MAG TPA: hypothetical protein VHO92_00365 [Methanobacterium sp.]|nr:hypothetical protein [Methanobacterium sp.]